MAVRNHAESNDVNVDDSARNQIANLQLEPALYQSGLSNEAVENRMRQSDTAAFAAMQGLSAINENNGKSVDNIFGRNEEMSADRLRLLVNVLELNNESPGKFGSDQGAFTPEQLASIGDKLRSRARNHSNPQASEAMIAVAQKYC